jgi:hypothetical protein
MVLEMHGVKLEEKMKPVLKHQSEESTKDSKEKKSVQFKLTPGDRDDHPEETWMKHELDRARKQI